MIVNNSWGASNRNEFTRADLIESAIDNAISHDCIVVFSAGNNSSITGPGMFYPSEYRPEILTVGAIKSNLLHWEYSTYGTHLDVVAPGANIISTNAGNNYFRDSGTSLAAP
jgi:subtilisin family serine protease